jgi:hypothetical protein
MKENNYKYKNFKSRIKNWMKKLKKLIKNKNILKEWN